MRKSGMTRAQLAGRARQRAVMNAQREADRQAWREGRRARLERLPQDAVWCVAHVVAGKENAAERALAMEGFHVYCPMQKVSVGSGARRIDVERALFPRYLFIAKRRAGADVHAVREVLGVLRDGQGQWARVAGADLAPLIDSEMRGAFDASDSRKRARAKARRAALTTGQCVTINDGPFAGIIGKINVMKGADRVELLIAALGGAVPVIVGIDMIAEAA